MTDAQSDLVLILRRLDSQLGPLRRNRDRWRRPRINDVLKSAVDHRHLVTARLHSTGMAPAAIAELLHRPPSTIATWITKGHALRARPV